MKISLSHSAIPPAVFAAPGPPDCWLAAAFADDVEAPRISAMRSHISTAGSTARSKTLAKSVVRSASSTSEESYTARISRRIWHVSRRASGGVSVESGGCTGVSSARRSSKGRKDEHARIAADCVRAHPVSQGTRHCSARKSCNGQLSSHRPPTELVDSVDMWIMQTYCCIAWQSRASGPIVFRIVTR